MTRRVPVILLTGFLGSGKTTLLNRLFRERPPARHGERGKIAIIVNELGDVGIDGDLLPAGSTRQVELPGGCICCQLVGDLETSVLEVLAAEPELEHLVIETTGVADPLPISWTLADDALRDHVRLAAVVTVVDAVGHAASRPESPSVDAQVRHADLLVLSRVDQLPGGVVPPELEASLRERNSFAPLIAEPPDRVAAALWRALDDPALPDAAAAAHPRDRAHAHDDGLRAAGVPADATLDLEDLVAALEDLPPSYLRIKGIVRAIDGESGATAPALFTVHRVGARVSTEPYQGPNQGSAAPRLVAVGRDVEPARLADCVAAAVVRS